jgi:hypothetical protein
MRQIDHDQKNMHNEVVYFHYCLLNLSPNSAKLNKLDIESNSIMPLYESNYDRLERLLFINLLHIFAVI